MFGDPLFPLPAADWLLVFDLILHRTSQVVADTDAEGFPVTTGAPAVAVKGYVAAPDTRQLREEGGEGVDTVVLLSNLVAVEHTDQIEVPAALPLPAQLRGRFRINTVRPNQSHTRLLCTRIADPEGSVR